MDHRPKVSILTSCYNHENFVEELVRSVYGQQGVDFEFLVIDDGSKDSSADKLALLSKQYDFSFEAQSNKGFTPTLNKLLKRATGDYLVIIASDDVLAPDRLKLQAQFLDQNQKFALVCGDVVELDEKGVLGTKVSYPFTAEGIFKKLLRKDIFILAPTVMVRRSIVEELDGWDESLAIEDWDMWLRIAEKYPLAYMDQVFALYRIHSGNSHANYMRMYSEMEKTLEKFKHNRLYEEAKFKMYRDAASYLSGISGYKKLAFGYFLKAVKKVQPQFILKFMFKFLFIWKH